MLAGVTAVVGRNIVGAFDRLEALFSEDHVFGPRETALATQVLDEFGLVEDTKARDELSSGRRNERSIRLKVHTGRLPDKLAKLEEMKELLLDGQFLVLPWELQSPVERMWISGCPYLTKALFAQLATIKSLRELEIVGPVASFPTEALGSLRHLRRLSIMGTDLAELPHVIGELKEMSELILADNALTAVPPAIGGLSSLRVLDLSDNQLQSLPSQLAQLSEIVQLRLDNNPLAEPLRELYEWSVADLFEYLRTLPTAEPRYEAKVVIVGEGKVGKSSLVAALSGKPFLEVRDTTHGIEISHLALPHPDHATDLTLNLWDFGGQEVYRVTHPFFFTRRALYVLVWNARQGHEMNAVVAWLDRIRLRLGDEARVMLVATECADRHPEIDYPNLRRLYGDMLVGCLSVDNRTNLNIDAVRDAIALECARLPQMGELWSAEWLQIRQRLAASRVPQLAIEDYLGLADSIGVSPTAARTLLGLLAKLGDVVYYGDDAGLRDSVVLQPEWLTKAIGFVLEDGLTREAAGVLSHDRLDEVWSAPGRTSYSPSAYPFFLRLMEKFDVSYRLPDEDASLVGQLVPYERPDIPWDEPGPPNLRELALTCRLSHPVPALVPWLTVRNHRFSTGRHWRRGVFLRHPSSASEALLELADDDRGLSLTVRAPSPDYFFSILRDSLEYLIALRWPGLNYELVVPCPARGHEGQPCQGTFKLSSLLRLRESGRVRFDCPECTRPQDVARMLTGFGRSREPVEKLLQPILKRVESVIDLQTATFRRVSAIESVVAETAQGIRAVLKAISAEVTDCPRLFTLVPAGRTNWRHAGLWAQRYDVTLWCEHAGEEHPCPDARYELQQMREWLPPVLKYSQLVLSTLQVAFPPLQGITLGLGFPAGRVSEYREDIALMREVLDLFPKRDKSDAERAREAELERGSSITRAQASGLRTFREWLLRIDHTRTFGELSRQLTPGGEYAWICPEHYSLYDPGLPYIPHLGGR